jgi:hypothetical protein
MNAAQILAQIKLRETRRQRDWLHRQYDAIEARVAQAATPLERLRGLHEGLRDLTFAQKPLHPDIVRLDALYLADELGVVPAELIADRTRLLEREMAQGRLRAEFTYAFGRILSEWSGPEAPPAAPQGAADADPLTLLWEAAPTIDAAWLHGLWRTNDRALLAVVEAVERFAATGALAPVQEKEVREALRRIATDSSALPGLRREATAVANSQAHVNEYGGVLTILLNSLDEWEWPVEGVPLRAVWARVKYRPYLDEDLITALVLSVVGARWGWKFKGLLAWKNLREGKGRVFREEPKSSPTCKVAEHRLDAQAFRFLATLKEGARQGGYYGSDALGALLAAVETELRFAPAAFPDRTLYVVHADLRDYYPSLSHELILACLEGLGVPGRWRAFFRKFLQARVRYRGEIRTIRRGMVLEHVLADVFGDVVLFLLDLHVYRTTGVQVIRVVDDLWLLADSREKAQAAWGAVQEFCRACGLSINEGKSGAVCLGPAPGPLDRLPVGMPRWGLLRLKPDGAWEVDEPAFACIEEAVRTHAAACPSVLSLVALYNGYVNYMLWQTAPHLGLRGEHLRLVGRRFYRMHAALFGPGHGLVEEVRRRLSGLFADARLQEHGLPAALLYWPITAGGLALAHPTLRVASFLAGRQTGPELQLPDRELVAAYLRSRPQSLKERPLSAQEHCFLLSESDTPGGGSSASREELLEGFRRRRAAGQAAPPTEEEDDVTAELWEQAYSRLVAVIEAAPPPQLPAMEQLVTDFINRGTEVSGRKQGGLSPYWRWVVYTYGPSLLEALGTFRFLMTELVPLPLILEARGGAAELEGDEAQAVAEPQKVTATAERKGGKGAAGENIPF